VTPLDGIYKSHHQRTSGVKQHYSELVTRLEKHANRPLGGRLQPYEPGCFSAKQPCGRSHVFPPQSPSLLAPSSDAFVPSSVSSISTFLPRAMTPSHPPPPAQPTSSSSQPKTLPQSKQNGLTTRTGLFPNRCASEADVCFRNWRAEGDNALPTSERATFDRITFLWCNDYHVHGQELRRFLKERMQAFARNGASDCGWSIVRSWCCGTWTNPFVFLISSGLDFWFRRRDIWMLSSTPPLLGSRPRYLLWRWMRRWS